MEIVCESLFISVNYCGLKPTAKQSKCPKDRKVGAYIFRYVYGVKINLPASIFHSNFWPSFRFSASIIGCGTVTTLLFPTFLNLTVRRFLLFALSISKAFCASDGFIISSSHLLHFHPLTSIPFHSVLIFTIFPPHSHFSFRFSNSIFIPHQFFKLFAQ